MRKRIDVTGQRFGRLVAVKEVEMKGKERCWLCRCDCGREKVIRMMTLRAGTTKSCGCLQKEKAGAKAVDIAGEQFGLLTAIKPDGKRRGGYDWICECVCGNKKKVPLSTLRQGHIKSCGCRKYSRNHRLDQEDILNELVDTYKNFGMVDIAFLTRALPFSIRSVYTHFPGKKMKEILAEVKEEYEKRSINTRSNIVDISGHKFGELTALYPLPERINNRIVWRCKCNCGNKVSVKGIYLTTGETKSCGCLKRKMDEKNLRDEYDNKRVSGVVKPLFKGKEPRKDSYTGFRGVSKYYTRKSNELRYRAWITVKGKRYYKSGFKSPEDAYYNGRLLLEQKHIPKRMMTMTKRPIDDYMTPAEAAYRWGVNQDAVKNRLKSSQNKRLADQLDEGIVKYFQGPGSQRKNWIITATAMERWYGREPNV